MGPGTDLLEVEHNFMDFFIDESSGWCVPCRAGNVILQHRLEKIMRGHGTESDLTELDEWCRVVKAMSRCGFGQMSPNPIQTTIRNFRHIYEAKLQKGADYATEFDLAAAVKDSCEAAGRKSCL
jgi:[NiFe] hydrogenase diaphorase moiety large subunit